MSRRALIAGVAAAASYVGAAVLTGATGAPVLPLFDGLAPPAPYRWVDPPESLAAKNEPPVPVQRELLLDEAGATPPDLVSTDDSQAQLSLPMGTFVADPKEKAVVLRITPLDPRKTGPPPRGLRFDGNAYSIEALTQASGTAVAPSQPVTLILRYPADARRLLRWTGERWIPVPGHTRVPATLQLYAEVSELGTFVSAGRPLPRHGVPWLRWVIYALVGLAVVAAVVVPRLRHRRGPAGKAGPRAPKR